MEIVKKTDGVTMTMAVIGRLDAITSEAFGAEAADVPAGMRCLVFDFARLEFISSAGTARSRERLQADEGPRRKREGRKRERDGVGGPEAVGPRRRAGSVLIEDNG